MMMKQTLTKKLLLAVAAVVGLSDVSARAVILTGSGDSGTGRNLSAPTGSLAGSGWDIQGKISGYLGTPISPTWFISANHINMPAANNDIIMNDGSHHLTTGNSQRIGGTDLIAYEVATPFASNTIASLYNPATDAPLSTSDKLVFFGRGVQRSTAVAGKGYLWGTIDANYSVSWGTNNFDTLHTATAAEAAGFRAVAGSRFIQAAFNNGVDDNEGVVTVGDSGGGLFVQRSGIWKLVGIVNGVDGFYNNNTGSNLVAAYDARGLYVSNGSGFSQVPNSASAVPANSFFSYVPDSLTALQAAVPNLVIPEPTMLGLAGIGVAGLLRRRNRA